MSSKCHKCKWENGRLIIFSLYGSLEKYATFKTKYRAK